MECPANIPNADKVVEKLGYWPGFHDAEIISFSASRGAPGQASTTSARLCVNVCQYKEVGCGTADYEVIRCKSILIEFLFTSLHRLSVEDFNHQNVINSIEFRQLEDQLVEVEIESIFGVGALIHCSHVEVVEVTSLL